MAFLNALKNLSKLQYLAATAVGCGSIYLIPPAIRYLKSNALNNNNFQSRFNFGIPDWFESEDQGQEVEVDGLRIRTKVKYGKKREDEEALYLRMECPGVDLENCLIIIELDEEGSMLFEGEALNESGEINNCIVYAGRLHLNPCDFDLESVTVNVINGVANVVVPKWKKTP